MKRRCRRTQTSGIAQRPTAAPALNPIIKVINLVSLLGGADAVLSITSSPGVWVMLAVASLLILGAFLYSRRKNRRRWIPGQTTPGIAAVAGAGPRVAVKAGPPRPPT